MNILYFTWDEIIKNDVITTLRESGHNVYVYSYELKNNISDAAFIKSIEKIIDRGYSNIDKLSVDAVESVSEYSASINVDDNYDKKVHKRFDSILSCNFLPVISKVAWRKKIKYISWCYDSPCMTLYSDMIYNPYNWIFHFDSYEVDRLRKLGVEHIYYMPLAVNTRRVSELLVCDDISGVGDMSQVVTALNADKTTYSAYNDNMKNYISLYSLNRPDYDSDITFMGNMYSSNTEYDELYNMLNDYYKGRFDSILKVNELFASMNLLDELINENMMKAISKSIEFTHIDEYNISDADIVKFVISKKISGNDRIRIIQKLTSKYKVDLYTTTQMQPMHNLCYKGILDYYNYMPIVFNRSKINVNITLRCIRRGIPLRAVDIMGAGGFLLSNYQQDLAELFVDGEDMVMFYDDDDMMNKVEYYLNHDDERCVIAANGRRKIMELYDYRNVWEKMFDIACTVD